MMFLGFSVNADLSLTGLNSTFAYVYFYNCIVQVLNLYISHNPY